MPESGNACTRSGIPYNACGGSRARARERSHPPSRPRKSCNFCRHSRPAMPSTVRHCPPMPSLGAPTWLRRGSDVNCTFCKAPGSQPGSQTQPGRFALFAKPPEPPGSPREPDPARSQTQPPEPARSPIIALAFKP